jgi:hypothetical protein
MRILRCLFLIVLFVLPAAAQMDTKMAGENKPGTMLLTIS